MGIVRLRAGSFDAVAGSKTASTSSSPKLHLHSGVDYRPDIDGLRAVAVLLVILFHAGMGVGGGFVGVDVFFVISGFLITKIVISDLRRDRFSFVQFYARRIRRIVPAFVVVCLATALVGLLIAVPENLIQLGKGLVAASVAATNILFWLRTDYFSSNSETNPLLHSWSLSVEEQFYLIFPFAIAFVSRRRPQALGSIIAIVLLVSLAAAELLREQAPSAAFFLPFSRAWELMAGSLIAVHPRLSIVRHRPWLVGSGVAMIFCAALFYTSSTPFPGIPAVLPVAGAALVLAAGGHGDPVGRAMLENRLMVATGRISYSLYLWHWPLFAYWRYWTSESPGLLASSLLLGASFGLAAVTYRYVEQPCRSSGAFRSVGPFTFAGCVAIGIALIGMAFYRSNGFPNRFGGEVREILASQYDQHRRFECVGRPGAWRDPGRPCRYGAATTPSLALWGDSHAFALIDGLGAQLERSGRSAAFLGYVGCPPFPGYRYPEVGNRCERYADGALQYLVRESTIRTVIIFARHAYYLEGGTEAFGPAEAGMKPLRATPEPLAGVRSTPIQAAYEDRFASAVRALRRAGKHVVLVDPVPEMGYDVPNTVSLRLIRKEADPNFSRSTQMYAARQWRVLPMLHRLAREYDVELVDGTDLFCAKGRCNAMRDGQLLYYDDDHISPYAAKLLAKRIVSQLDQSADHAWPEKASSPAAWQTSSEYNGVLRHRSIALARSRE